MRQKFVFWRQWKLISVQNAMCHMAKQDNGSVILGKLGNKPPTDLQIELWLNKAMQKNKINVYTITCYDPLMYLVKNVICIQIFFSFSLSPVSLPPHGREFSRPEY